MFVIRLPSGNLLVPESALAEQGQVLGDAYVEIGPDDPDYARLAQQALTDRELQQRRRRWQEGDAALQREFEDFLARRDRAGQGGGPSGGDA
ncbi:MAG TPA: hypothetical protein VG253_22540 [Streptosporangiaceae bacterium]|jgi:hypothetical protein|nr:hypothetical protein [Streptosporangiaceae bacterium]